jgi:hypothetical protein
MHNECPSQAIHFIHSFYELSCEISIVVKLLVAFRRALEEKAKMYDKLSRGEVNVNGNFIG